MSTTLPRPLDFTLPPHLEAAEPPEARGLRRDAVRLLVSYRGSDRLVHATFTDLPAFLAPGDLLVINTSGTLNAALPAIRPDHSVVELHLSTQLPAGLWSVELRLPADKATAPVRDAQPGEILDLPGGASCTLHRPYHPGQARLHLASLGLPCPLLDYLDRHGFPIRYGYVPERWPAAAYQTVYATEPGSAEMPSAGRAFTPELITRLVAAGIAIAPLILHTGVASPEDHEPPYEEQYRVGPATARQVNATHQAGGRVIAVGTTVIRALETATDEAGVTHPAQGWTDLVIAPPRRLQGVDALLTGLHEPRSSHLAMLAALAGRPHLELTYAEALRAGYLWHEFGDLHLILP